MTFNFLGKAGLSKEIKNRFTFSAANNINSNDESDTEEGN